ncbi:MAG: hypothetical protein ACT4PX_12700 [Actinomycetota bacterium]
MSDTVDVDQDQDRDEGLDGGGGAGLDGTPPVTGLGILPQSLMDPVAPAPEAAPAEPRPMAGTAATGAERPAKQGLLVRLGHMLCGFRG